MLWSLAEFGEFGVFAYLNRFRLMVVYAESYYYTARSAKLLIVAFGRNGELIGYSWVTSPSRVVIGLFTLFISEFLS